MMNVMVRHMLAMSLLLPAVCEAATQGPLRKCEKNPRYFADRDGRPVYLTGAHTWANLIDMGPTDPPPRFDYDAYLAWMQEHDYNFMRLWTWELPQSAITGGMVAKSTFDYAAPMPWKRTGPGMAGDKKPRFDLKHFDDAYFKRLRTRVQAAQERGIYVSIMLFEGWGAQLAGKALEYHPFSRDNNVNGISADKNGDGRPMEVHELGSKEILALQEVYVRKVIDTVNDLDNVLYEISNECQPQSTEWQYHVIRLIKDYEKKKPKQHPVGMTFQYKGGSNKTLWESPADWISPNPDGGYRDNPPASDGRKVVISDTDHLWGIGGDRAWAWKSFTRGLNPIFMDPYNTATGRKSVETRWEDVRKALRQTRGYARRMDLASAIPHGELCSTGFCLAAPGREYLVYLPEKKPATLDLSAAKGELSVEWFEPATGTVKWFDKVAGGKKVEFH